MPSAKLFNSYKQIRLEWDDPSGSNVFFIPTEEMENTLLGIRIVVTANVGYVTPALVTVPKPFFLDKHKQLDPDESLFLLSLIESTINDQINDANESRLRLISFQRKMSPILQSLKSPLS